MNSFRLELQTTNERWPNFDGGELHRGLLFIDETLQNENYAISYWDLARSANEAGNYFILTCGCGVPECARLNDPIAVEHDGNILSWCITDPEPKRHFTFDRDKYKTEVLRFLKEAQATVPRPQIPEDFTFGHYGFRPSDLDECVDLLESNI
jgi:hypothetical protein